MGTGRIPKHSMILVMLRVVTAIKQLQEIYCWRVHLTNSTSVDAWIAQLSSLRGLSPKGVTVNADETPVVRS